jgi:hypothetical protein
MPRGTARTRRVPKQVQVAGVMIADVDLSRAAHPTGLLRAVEQPAQRTREGLEVARIVEQDPGSRAGRSASTQ